MVDFGWSASCILEAIKLSNKIRKALQDAGGAKDEYDEATLFLTHFESVFKELEGHIRDDTESSYRETIVQQMKLMEPPTSRLESLLSKYEKSLGDHQTKSKVRTVAHKVKWALKDLNDAVHSERDELRGPLQTVSLFLQLQSMCVTSHTTVTSAYSARKTIRATNETCQKMVGEIEASSFAISLQQGIEQVRQYGEENEVRQHENRAYLASLKRSLDMQHLEIMDTLQNERQAYEVLIQSAYTTMSEHVDNSISLPEGMETLIDQKTSFERMHAQLEAQQSSLDDVCRALRCLTSEIHEEAIALKSSQEQEINSSPILKEAMSIIRIAVTAGSIFALGYSTVPALSNLHLDAALTPISRRTESHEVQRAQAPQHRAPRQLEKWTAEFADFNLEPLHVPETRVYVDSTQKAHDAPSSSVSSSHLNTSDYYTWRCCHCDNGPYTKGHTTCWGCWNPHCGRCPRTVLPTLNNEAPATFRPPKYERIEYHHPDTGHRAWRWNFWAPRPSRGTAEPKIPTIRSNMRKGFSL